MKRLTLRQEISVTEALKGGDIAHQNMTEPNIHIIRKSTEGSSGLFRAALLRLKGGENIAKNIATPGLLAYIATAKYADVLPCTAKSYMWMIRGGPVESRWYCFGILPPVRERLQLKC
jgi:hypothetical protein